MKNKKVETTETTEKPIEITPEQALQDFVLRMTGENRHTRRWAGKMVGFKITGTQKPYVKEKEDSKKEG